MNPSERVCGKVSQLLYDAVALLSLDPRAPREKLRQTLLSPPHPGEKERVTMQLGKRMFVPLSRSPGMGLLSFFPVLFFCVRIPCMSQEEGIVSFLSRPPRTRRGRRRRRSSSSTNLPTGPTEVCSVRSATTPQFFAGGPHHSSFPFSPRRHLPLSFIPRREMS